MITSDIGLLGGGYQNPTPHSHVVGSQGRIGGKGRCYA